MPPTPDVHHYRRGVHCCIRHTVVCVRAVRRQRGRAAAWRSHGNRHTREPRQVLLTAAGAPAAGPFSAAVPFSCRVVTPLCFPVPCHRSSRGRSLLCVVASRASCPCVHCACSPGGSLRCARARVCLCVVECVGDLSPSCLAVFQTLVAGESEVDVAFLKSQTKYEGFAGADDAVVARFWRVFGTLSNHDRAQYVRFAWGRARLPPRGARWTN